MKTRSDPKQFPLEPPLDFLRHVWEVNHALERRSLQMERTLGVTGQQRLFLRCIGKYPGIKASQLSAVLHLDRTTVSVALRRLSHKKLITRRADPHDSRRVSLGLTARGKALARADASTVEFAVERLIRRTGAPEIARVKEVLRDLAESLLVGLTNGT